MERVALVTLGAQALVTTSLGYRLACDHEGCTGSTELFGAWLGGERPPAWTSLPSSSTGISPGKSAVAVTLHGELLALTQGHHGYATMDPKQSPNELWLVSDSGETKTKLPSRQFTAVTMVSTSDGSLVAATGMESSWMAVAMGGAASEAVRVLAVEGERKIGDELVYRSPGSTNIQAVPRAPRSPAIAAGVTRAAVTYRIDDELWVAEVDRRTGRRLTAPRRIARGEIGQAALAFEGDELHALFARRTRGKPYVIEHAYWGKGLAAEPTIDVIIERTDSAIAPSIAFGGGRWLVAWMEGDLSRRGRVLFGTSQASVGDAVAHAEILSPPNVNARDPKVALTTTRGGGGWLVWGEFGGPGMSLRYAPLSSCP